MAKNDKVMSADVTGKAIQILSKSKKKNIKIVKDQKFRAT